ncbi:unnamed protein product [Absidia cylindrospora]
MNYRDPLPAEIIIDCRTITYKGSKACALVNWWFHTITTPILWRIVIIREEDQLTQFVSGLVASCPEKNLGGYVQCLALYVPMSGAGLLLLTKYLPMLKTLALDIARGVTDACIPYLAEYCPLIQSLSLSRAFITNQVIVTICKHYPHLTSLGLEKCGRLTPRRGAFAALKSCTSLRQLTLDVGAFQNSWNHYPDATNRMMHDLLALKSLTKLSLMDCPRGFGSDLLKHVFSKEQHHRNNAAAAAAAATTPGPAAAGAGPTTTTTTTYCWPDLTEFSLDGCTGMDDKRMALFLKLHPKITTLGLNKGDFTDGLLGALPNLVPGLTSLSLADAQRISAKGVRRLVVQCHALAYINIVESEAITAVDFPEVDGSCFGTSREIHGPEDDEEDEQDDYDDDDFYGYGRRHDSDDERYLYLMHLDQKNIDAIRWEAKHRQRQKQKQKQPRSRPF